MKNMNILVGVLTSKIFEMFSFKIGIQKKHKVTLILVLFYLLSLTLVI